MPVPRQEHAPERHSAKSKDVLLVSNAEQQQSLLNLNFENESKKAIRESEILAVC